MGEIDRAEWTRAARWINDEVTLEQARAAERLGLGRVEDDGDEGPACWLPNVKAWARQINVEAHDA